MPKYIEIDDVQYVKSNFARLASKRGDEFNHVLNMEVRVEDKDVKVCKEILRQRLPHLFTPSGLLKQNVFHGMSMRSFGQVLQYAYCDEIEGRKLNSRELLFLINWCMKWNMPDRLKALLWNRLSSCTDATNCVDVYFQMESMNGKLDEVKRFREYCLHVMKSYVCNNSASQVVDLSDHPELLETIIYKPHENFTDFKLPVSSYTSDMTKIIGCKGVVCMKIMMDPSTSMRVSPTVMAVQSPAINAFLLQNRHLASSGYPPFNLYNFGVSEDMYNVLSDEQKEVRRRVIKKFVTLLHTGKFRGTLEETSLLVDLMHYLQLTKIPGYSYCIQAITSQIDASNVLKIARTFFSEKSQACDNGLNAIRNRVVEVMSSIPFQKGMMKRQLKELSKDLLVDVLCHTSDTSEMPKKERVHKPTMNQAVC